MVMEQLNGGEVYQRILKVRRFSEKDSALIINDVIKGLMYIHGIQILHRDLKLENILFSNRENNLGVKIVDFGLATFTDRTDIFKHCGTPGYVAPEMLHDKDYGTKVDMFSTSVMLFSLYLPFSFIKL
jgi:serine/threonine protein kinase